MVHKIAGRSEDQGFAIHPTTGKLCQLRSKWVIFSNHERRGMGSTFHQLCPRYSGSLTSTVLMAIRLWETLNFYPLRPLIRLLLAV